MADPTVKQVTLIPGAGATGAADVELEAAAIGGRRIVLDSEGGGGSRRRGRGSGGKAKTYRIGTITKEGGGSTSPGTVTQLSASHIPGSVGAATAVGINSDLTQKGAPVVSGGAAIAITGGAATHAKPVKVVLAAPKKAKSKVILAAAAAKPAGSATKPLAAMLATSKHGAKTHKASRKVRISMAGLSRKIHKAKTIRNKASSESLESIKKALYRAGLIKAESKAPEYILRQMYADFMTLKNRAL